jgi:hypothetical protein
MLERFPGGLGRRQLLAGGLALLGGACSGARLPSIATGRGALGGSGAVELWSWFDLPNDPRSRELSGLAWDPREAQLWAVQDERPSIVALVPDKDLRSWTFGETLPVDIEGTLDLEGLVLLPDGFVVCSEVGPRIIEVDRQGHFRRDIPLPPRFRDARTNKSLESLTVSPSGRYVFTTTEVALPHDGAKATREAGTRVRIVRFDADIAKRGGTIKGQVSEHVYETDPAPIESSDWGVSDLAAVADDELLVLERGWAKGYGNTIRIYHVKLENRASCLSVDQLSTGTPALAKSLRVDLGQLHVSDVPASKQPQPNALLDNYEGIAIGPYLPDGRRAVLLVSDDNGHADQVARILVLAFS